MPHEWNNIWVVTMDELVPTYFSSLPVLKVCISRASDKPYGIKKVQSGGNGRQLLISFDSLPKEIQEAMGDPRKLSHIMEMFYKTDDDAVRCFTEYKFENGNWLSLEHQEEYITNASVLKSAIALRDARTYERKTKGGPCKGIMTTVCNDVASFNKTLKAKHGVEHTLPSSERWFKEIFKSFSNEGKDGFNYQCLISKKLNNSNAQKVTDYVVKLLNDLFAGQGKKPTRTEISRQFDAFLGGYIEVIDSETGEMYEPKGFKKLSDATIINYLGGWQERIGTYSKRGGDRQKLMQQFKPYHSLEKPVYAGSIISIDDRQPPFEYAKGKRVWFYNGIDLASEAFICWVHGKSKEGIIIEFYRQLVRNYTKWGFNLPAELEAEMSLNSSYVNTFLRPGVLFSENVRIEANNARGKRIERYYGALRYEIEKDREGWLARPFALSESNQMGKEPVPIIPYNEITNNGLMDIETWNNMPHATEPDITRWEYFCKMQHPNLKPTNWNGILPHLGYSTTTSCNVGIIKLNNKEFLLGEKGEVMTGEPLINAMKKVEGRTVTVYWLDDDKGEVIRALVFLGTTMQCEAVAKPTYNRAIIERTEKGEKNREVMSAYVATIEGYMRMKVRSISDVVVIDNRQKTLNNKFRIEAAQRYEPKEMEETEILEEPMQEDDFVMMPATTNSFVRSTKDRI